MSTRETRRVTWTSLLLAVMTFSAGVVFPWIFSAFSRMFEDIGEDIPRLTTRLLATPGWVWPVLGTIVSCGLLGKDRKLSRTAASRVNTGVILAEAVFVTVVVLALFSPLLNIVKTMER